MSESPVRSAATADITLQLSGKTAEDTRVISVEGREGLSELFSYEVNFVSDDSELAPATFVGKMALLEIAGPRGSRFVHGLVHRFVRKGQRQKYYHYAVHLTAGQWLLTKRRRCRIFQSHNCSEMTAPGIIKKVFEGAGFQTSSFRLSLAATYPAREYCVQYRETEFEFISRLMEEEGIYYFFEHSPTGHVMVIADGPVSHVVCPNYDEVVYREPIGLVPEKDVLQRADEASEIRAGAARLKDFDFVRPAVSLMKAATGGTLAALEIYDYPGDFLVEAEGERLATARLQAEQWRATVFSFGGDPRGLIAGYKFTLAEHPVTAMNAEYLVVRQAIRATQPQSAEAERDQGAGATFEADILAIPGSVNFRSERVTPRPIVPGAQTALVVGPSGEEIYTDKYGRVKVQFHWDLEGVYNENSSCWIRVSHGMAGGQYGSLFLPRVGQEVVVSFLEGNPDRPLITGRVYNNDQMPPYTLPDDKTKSVIKTNSSTGGGGTNELTFEDLKDSEKILLYAQKDLHIRVINDRVENVDHHHYLTVKENQYELIKKEQHCEVKLDRNEKVGGKYSLKVAGDQGVEVAGNHSTKSDGNLYLKAGQNLVLEATSGLTLKVGGNFIKIDSSGIAIAGTMTKINSGGSAGNGSAVSLTAPAETIESDTATPGSDKTYSAQALAVQAVAQTEEFAAVQVPETPARVASWVEIEMVDEEGQPWPDEYYEVTLPDGKVRKGYLDKNGRAHILLSDPVNTQVSFPRLDSEAWERLS